MVRFCIAPVALVFLAAVAPAARAAEGIPNWNRVVEEVLERAEAEAARERRAGETVVDEPAPAAHPTVNRFIRYFRTAGAKSWSNSLERLEAIRPAVERIFDEEGVPRDLLWLGLVESGYNPLARSPKDALGVWQFIPATARRFGLAVGARDERTDLEKSTRAAAGYLRYLFEMFGDWNLALAAYNSGEARVQSAIDRGGSRDFWKLAGEGLLPRETAAYVPAVLAAQILGAGKTVAAEAKPKMLEAPFSLSP